MDNKYVQNIFCIITLIGWCISLSKKLKLITMSDEELKLPENIKYKDNYWTITIILIVVTFFLSLIIKMDTHTIEGYVLLFLFLAWCMSVPMRLKVRCMTDEDLKLPKNIRYSETTDKFKLILIVVTIIIVAVINCLGGFY